MRGRDCTPFWLEGANRTLGRRWDVVTFNFGLHDLANDTELVPLDKYKANLRNISLTLLAALQPEGGDATKRLFWLSSTPVPNVALSPPRAQA